MEEKISVIIPCYNVEKYIGRCLTSVVEQTIGLQMLEIICVNDASTDNTWEELCAWERRYPENILLINFTENGAQGRARNVALSHATGAYVTFLDSDDWVERDAYEKAYQAMKTYDCDIVRYGYIRDNGVDDVWNIHEKSMGKDWLLVISDIDERKKFLATDIMGHLCVDKVYKAKWIQESQLSFPEGCKYEDIFWGVLSYYYGTRIYFLNEIMYHYYKNPNSTVMTQNISYHMDRFDVVLQLWEECKKRELLKDYQKEAELNFLIYYYLDGIKMMALCYTDLKYQKFQELCQTVQNVIPNYKENLYINEILSELDQLQIALIDQNITKED